MFRMLVAILGEIPHPLIMALLRFTEATPSPATPRWTSDSRRRRKKKMRHEFSVESERGSHTDRACLSPEVRVAYWAAETQCHGAGSEHVSKGASQIQLVPRHVG